MHETIHAMSGSIYDKTVVTVFKGDLETICVPTTFAHALAETGTCWDFKGHGGISKQ